jgi:RNA-directed DNA polymerase
MDKKHRYFEQLCDPAFLLHSWKQVRVNRGVAGVDQVTVFEYERNLTANIEGLAARLRDGSYLPMPLIHFQMQKPDGKMRSLGIATVEDRIVSRALYDLFERIWEPVFLDCSFGFRPNRNAEMAVKRVLDYRAAGDCHIVDADLADAFSSLDHEIVMNLIGQRLRDKRLLGLIRLVLAAAQSNFDEAQSKPGEAPVIERVTDFATGAVNDAVTHLLGDNYGSIYSNYSVYPSMSETDAGSPADAAAELRKSARREAYKRLGRDALLLGLTYLGRTRRLFSPTSLAMTGAAVLATATYPKASRFVRRYWGNGFRGVGAVQGSAFSPMLLNIVMHEFDVEMTRAGFHLARYADDWVVTTSDQGSAQRALDFAARKLADLHLKLNPEKTRIIRFEQGLEFLGYKFDPFQLTATPPSASTQQPVKLLLNEAATAIRVKTMPEISRLGKEAIGKGRAGVNRVTGYIKRRIRREK